MTDFIGGNVNIKKLTQALAASGMLTVAACSQAAEVGGVELRGSGFLTVAAGAMLDGTSNNVADNNCPCFAADYAQAAVYDGRKELQFNPDSKLGLQGTAAVANGRFSVTAQAVARGATKKVNLEWLYASLRANDTITIQAGRKRLPMFYYSDTQDIGVALPWTHLPPQLYGWEAVNYNGMNLMYQDQWGSWSATSNILAGSESINDAGYDRIYYGRQSRTDVKWDHIVGGDLTLQKDWFETRFVYIQSTTSTRNVSGTWDAALGAYDPATSQTDFGTEFGQEIFGLTFNVDYESWLARSEFIRINRPGQTFRDNAYIVAAGKRVGKWQLLLTQSSYWGTAVVENGGDPTAQEAHVTNSATLRYDLTTSSDVKVQYDYQHDQSGPNWVVGTNGAPYGDARLLTVAYDMVF
jgi:hypothetical protein